MPKAKYEVAFDYSFNFNSVVGHPIVPVTINGKTLQSTVPFLVDSGASVTTVHPSIVDGVDLDMSNAKEVVLGTAGGDVKALAISAVKIEINRHLYTVPIRITETASEDFGLLGREGFFPLVQVAFREARKKVYFAFSP